MPAMSNISFMGGMDFIRPETKPAVAVLPSLPSPPSQTVTLSILMFLTASTWMRISSSILSASIRRTALSALPPAAETICRRPSACLSRISWAPWASACILARMASASPRALRRICSASASASSSMRRLSISVRTMTSASWVAFSRWARASSAFCSAA